MSERCSTRCLAAGVELIDLVLFRDVDDRKQVATDADIGGVGHIEGRCGRDSGVDGIATLHENSRARHCREWLNR